MPRPASFDRDAALTAARDLFWRQGYHGTSMKDLEGALDLRPGSIYAAFGSKEALYAEALAHYGAASRKAAMATIDAAVSPLVGLADHLRALGAACDGDQPSNACMLVKTVLEIPEETNLLRQTAKDLMAEAEAGFAAQFARAQAEGQLPKDADPARLGRRYQADVIGLRAYAERSGSATAVRALADDMAAEIEALAATE